MNTPISINANVSQPVQTATHKVAAMKKSSGGGNKKGTSAERRATHNAVERARRESLNVRFLELAANLPATCTVRRPSKNLIVNKSLEFVRNALHNDAVLRLKLDEVMRHNQSLLQELNQLRAERGQSPRANPTSIEALRVQQQQAPSQRHSFHANSYSSIPSSTLPRLSTDALISAYGLPGLPQPLASAEFTKQVTEQSITLDLNDASRWFGNDGEDETSNAASADDFSAAASDHSSPSLAGDQSSNAFASTVHTFPTNAMFQGVSLSASPHQTHQPPMNSFASPQPLSNAYSPSAASATFSDGSSSYAHYSGSMPTLNVGAPATSPSLDYPPITPTTSAVYQQFLANIGTHRASGDDTSVSVSQAHRGSTSSAAPSASVSNPSAYAHGGSGFYAMPA